MIAYNINEKYRESAMCTDVMTGPHRISALRQRDENEEPIILILIET